MAIVAQVRDVVPGPLVAFVDHFGQSGVIRKTPPRLCFTTVQYKEYYFRFAQSD